MGGISDLLDSDMEDSVPFIDENSILSSASDVSSVATSRQKPGQAKKPKKRHRVTMPKKAKVAKPSEEAPAKKATKKATNAKRKVLEEQINSALNNEHVDDMDAEVVTKQPTRKPASKQREDDVEEMEVDQTPLVARSNHASSKNNVAKVMNKTTATTKSKQPKAAVQPAVPQSQHEISIETDEADIFEEVPLPALKSKSRTESRVRQEPPFRRRAGSASDTERGDPNLRRKLGDVTRKFENIDLKYQSLKEVGINEANANMEKLRKQCEAATAASNELIASLKKELAMQAPLAQDSRKLRRELQTRDAETAQMKTHIAELTSSLATAQNEIKALQAKLSASRSASVPVESAASKTPGSALKGAGQVRTVMVGSAEAVQAAQVAQMKEDLYSDLTGLIIRGVKRTEEGETFDCIQTGRNGTLHFKLYIDQEDAKTASFEETEFLYTPLLDPNRDRDLMELMPEYLTEDITFARQNAAKFYGRVVDTLTKRRVEE